MPSEFSKYVSCFESEYIKKTQNSKKRAAESRLLLADPRASASFRFSTKELLYPIVGKSAKGAYFTDVDGNDYLDLAMGFGCLLFGHYPEFLVNAIKHQLSTGIQLGPQSDTIHEVVQLLNYLTGIDRFAFCNSGAEAVMMSCRLARLYSKKRKIVTFTNSYHGAYDATQILKHPNTIQSMPSCDGLPYNFNEDILVCDYNSIEGLDALIDYKDQIAAIIVEPVRSRAPGDYSKSFLQEVRFVANKYNAVLIFDEIITGFRCDVGGAKAYFDVNPDLVTYGKIIAGGIPIGIVGGNADIMAGVDGGNWYYGDNSYPANPTTFFAGTFNKNPLVACTMHAILTELKHQGTSLINSLNETVKVFAESLNEFFSQNLIPIRMSYFSSLMKFEFRQNLDLFFYHLIHQGIYIWEGKTMFLSRAHTSSDLERFKAAIKTTCLQLREFGYFQDL